MRCQSNMHYSRVYFACLIIGMGLNQRRWLKSEGLLGARVYLLFCVGVTRPYGRSPSWQRTLAVIPSIQCGSSIQTRAGMKEAPAGRWESRAALNLDDWNKSLDWNRFITTMCVRRATTTWFIKICGLYSATNIALKHFSPLAECIKMKISLANWQWCQSLITEVVHFYFWSVCFITQSDRYQVSCQSFSKKSESGTKYLGAGRFNMLGDNEDDDKVTAMVLFTFSNHAFIKTNPLKKLALKLPLFFTFNCWTCPASKARAHL